MGLRSRCIYSMHRAWRRNLESLASWRCQCEATLEDTNSHHRPFIVVPLLGESISRKRRPAWQKGKPRVSLRNGHPGDSRQQVERGGPLRANPRHRGARRRAGAVRCRGSRDPGLADRPDGRRSSVAACRYRPCPEPSLPTRIIAPARAPAAQVHPLGTDGFRYWTAAEALRRSAAFWATAGATRVASGCRRRRFRFGWTTASI